MDQAIARGVGLHPGLRGLAGPSAQELLPAALIVPEQEAGLDAEGSILQLDLRAHSHTVTLKDSITNR